jgi:alpha-beta hydrolase superfamily lysophospholipase
MPDQDPVVGSETSQKLFQKLGSEIKVLKIYPERMHEIYNDIGRDEVFADIKKFLSQFN